MVLFLAMVARNPFADAYSCAHSVISKRQAERDAALDEASVALAHLDMRMEAAGIPPASDSMSTAATRLAIATDPTPAAAPTAPAQSSGWLWLAAAAAKLAHFW